MIGHVVGCVMACKVGNLCRGLGGACRFVYSTVLETKRDFCSMRQFMREIARVRARSVCWQCELGENVDRRCSGGFFRCWSCLA